MTDMQRDANRGVGEGFSSTATDYDAVLRHNFDGARRLVASLPDRPYERLLDVGCGTGMSTVIMLERFPQIRRVIGVDLSDGMLDVFRGRQGELPGVELDIRHGDVMDMGVEPESVDVVISSMAMHWFPDKPGAAARMAEPLAPGGVMGILCSGTGGDQEYREVMAALDPPAPPEWDATFDFALRDVDQMEDYLLGAGLEPIDIWMERRIRHTTPEAYMERMRVVAGHVTSHLTTEELDDYSRRILEGMEAVSGPRGFRYTFNKLYAVAQKPE